MEISLPSTSWIPSSVHPMRAELAPFNPINPQLCASPKRRVRRRTRRRNPPGNISFSHRLRCLLLTAPCRVCSLHAPRLSKKAIAANGSGFRMNNTKQSLVKNSVNSMLESHYDRSRRGGEACESTGEGRVMLVGDWKVALPLAVQPG